MNGYLMLAGLVAGLALGLAASATGSPLLMAAATGVEPLGVLFIRALQMVVIPLVMAVVFTGVARLGDLRTLGRVGGTALGFIVFTTIPAVVMGMSAMGLALRWVPDVPVPEGEAVVTSEVPGVVDFLVGLVPRNPFAAAAAGELLPLLVFAVLFGAATGALSSAHREQLVELADAVGQAFIKLVMWILWTAPVGIFALAAPATARMGLGLLQSLAVFVAAVVVALFVFMTLVYLPAVVVLGRMSPGRFIRGTLASYTMCFTTTSSVATLPVLLRDAPELGVSSSVADLVLPLAAALNRAGSGLFQGASVVFLAHLFGIDVPGGVWVGAALACFFAASTVAPIPSASIMTLAPALDVVGVPLAGLGLLLGVDRVPDMFRSGTNATGHMAAAVVTQGRVGSSAVSEAGPVAPQKRQPTPSV
jgi:Na+/H+-dicarboxylate symporter